MKTILASLIVAAAVAPVAALAAAPSGDATTSAQASCTALKAKLGASAFTQAYSTFGGCVSKLAPVEQQSIDSAQATCSAQQQDVSFAASHDGKTFDQYYGNGKTNRNSFGNCVSSLAKASSQAERRSRLNPAQTCRASQKSLGQDAFDKLYRNFGKCVSAVAKAQNRNEVSASAACKAEQAKDEAAFEQKYSSFGVCVSGQARQASTEQQQATVNAARQCYAQLKADAAAFKSKYATFGRCVSQTAQA